MPLVCCNTQQWYQVGFEVSVSNPSIDQINESHIILMSTTACDMVVSYSILWLTTCNVILIYIIQARKLPITSLLARSYY